ncbi:MAG: hypothetical protein IPO01_19035 [Chitinophagaceae bacterium]|nr:hypothetical protein [Chitinophagaceae bacterium]MBK7308734.1 hypothetical protein [Chitinophagaceae bacterium]MBK8785711.1 hypothetical protein [Chitinophagaceae bacterium]MBK9487200.1 hypothetical protein [Chitinophagaceae bacterium]MBL0199588.1 hypothetical protein [Chitinophagaceae bacterium]
MKKIKTVLTAIVMLLSISSFATETKKASPDPEKVTPVVKAAFESDFSKATLVKWDKTDEFYFASFLLNNVKVDAAYTENGELIGTSRRISADQMPLSISVALAENYSGYVADNSVVELTHLSVTRYYVTVSNKTQTVKLKCFSNGELEVESKTKK